MPVPKTGSVRVQHVLWIMLSDLPGNPQHSSLSSSLQNMSGRYNTVLGVPFFRICETYVIEMWCNRRACHELCLLDRRSAGLCVWYTPGCSCEPPSSLNTHPGAFTQSFVFMLCKLPFLTFPMRSLQVGGVPGLTGCSPSPALGRAVQRGPITARGMKSSVCSYAKVLCVALALPGLLSNRLHLPSCNPFSLQYRFLFLHSCMLSCAFLARCCISLRFLGFHVLVFSAEGETFRIWMLHGAHLHWAFFLFYP